jgi:hypothetical protein
MGTKEKMVDIETKTTHKADDNIISGSARIIIASLVIAN